MGTSTAGRISTQSYNIGYDLTPIEIRGKSYEVEASTISEAYMGHESHGLLIANLSFEGTAWTQREPAYSRSAEDLGHYLRSVLTVTRAHSWDRLAGTPVLTLRENIMGAVEGFASPDQRRILLFNGGRSSEVIFRD